MATGWNTNNFTSCVYFLPQQHGRMWSVVHSHGDHGEWPLQVSGQHPASEEPVRVRVLSIVEDNLKENLLCSLTMKRKNSPSLEEMFQATFLILLGINNMCAYIHNGIEKIIKGENCECTWIIPPWKDEKSLSLSLHCTHSSLRIQGKGELFLNCCRNNDH